VSVGAVTRALSYVSVFLPFDKRNPIGVLQLARERADILCASCNRTNFPTDTDNAQ
jgi:hypothetical protein